MNIEQLIARHQNKKILLPLRDEQVKAATELESDKQVLGVMLKSQGWKVYERYIQRDKGLLENALKTINPADTEAVRGLQSDIRSYEKIMSFIKNFTN